jgi:RNA polymerase sigma-70 factor (ECF subfamily)
MSDEELALQVQGNNPDAFGVLIDRYQDKLLRYGRRFLANPDNIEDIVQDVFIGAYKNIKSFDTKRKFSPWIYRIAHNAFANALRKKHREPIVFIDLDMMVAHPKYENDYAGEEDKREAKEIIGNGLDSLPASYREVVVLYYFEELGYQEIADILHIPIGTVGIRLRRAKEILKRIVLNKNEFK